MSLISIMFATKLSNIIIQNFCCVLGVFEYQVRKNWQSYCACESRCYAQFHFQGFIFEYLFLQIMIVLFIQSNRANIITSKEWYSIARMHVIFNNI